MKIQKINNFGYRSINQNILPKRYINSYKDEVCFGGKKNNTKKRGIKDSIKGIFKKQNNPVMACYTLHGNEDNSDKMQIKSRQIKNTVAHAVEIYSAVQASNMFNTNNVKKILMKGKEKDYKEPIFYEPNKKTNVKITFGEINQELGVPDKFYVWENGEFHFLYEISQLEPEIQYEITEYQGNVVAQRHVTGYKTTLVNQVDKEKHTYKEIEYTDEGFNFMYGKFVDNDEELIVKARIYMNLKDISKCLYAEKVGKNGSATFRYNPQVDLWKCVGLIPDKQE